jgi:hypothetical protein
MCVGNFVRARARYVGLWELELFKECSSIESFSIFEFIDDSSDVLDGVAFEDGNNLLDDFDFGGQFFDFFLEVVDFGFAESVVRSEGVVQDRELTLPLFKVVDEGIDFVSESDDFRFESEDLVGSVGDLVVQRFNTGVVFSLSVGFSGGFRGKAVSFGSEQVIDNFQNGTNEFLVGLDGDFLGHLHEDLEQFLSGVRSEGGDGGFGVSGDLSEDLVGGLLEERRGLQGNDESSGLLEGFNHGVVVSGALGVGGDGLVVGIVGIGEVAVGLGELFFFTSLVVFVGGLLESEVGEVSFTLVDLCDL